MFEILCLGLGGGGVDAVDAISEGCGGSSPEDRGSTIYNTISSGGAVVAVTTNCVEDGRGSCTKA